MNGSDSQSRRTPRPLSPPLELTAVWCCDDTDQAEALLSGREQGYVYQRDGHPNADAFAAACGKLHRTPRAIATSSGMAAMAAGLLSQVQAGDHLVASNQLYGQSHFLIGNECRRLGIEHTLVDPTDPAAVDAACTSATRLVVVETIANPLLRVANLEVLAERAHRHGARLLVDNTFATPHLCQPAALGADLVVESVSKLINGHSDVMLGLLCGSEAAWERVPAVVSAWGLASSPLDCWLALRGLHTLALRADKASENALAIAHWLASQQGVARVDYPGLPQHPDHELAARQFGGSFGSVVTFELPGGRGAVDALFAACPEIPFAPSLGDYCTTWSHPESTSHRKLSLQERDALGIRGGTIRLSVGIEPVEQLLDQLRQGLPGSHA